MMARPILGTRPSGKTSEEAHGHGREIERERSGGYLLNRRRSTVNGGGLQRLRRGISAAWPHESKGRTEGNEGGGSGLYSHGHGALNPWLKHANSWAKFSDAFPKGRTGVTSCDVIIFFLFFFFPFLLIHIAYNFCFRHQKSMKPIALV